MPAHLLDQDTLDNITDSKEMNKLTSFNDMMVDEDSISQKQFLQFVNMNFERHIIKPFNKQSQIYQANIQQDQPK